MSQTGGIYRLNGNWLAGEAAEKRFQIGSPAAAQNEEHNLLGFLRVGYSGAALQEACDAMVYPADNGTAIGPLDLPFMIVCEAPATVAVKPVAGSPRSAINIVLSMVPAGAPSDRLYATRSIVAVLNQVIPLPQWVRGVSALQNAMFTFRDRGSVALSTSLLGAHDRPAIAAEILVDVAGTFTLYY
jgi:hypothetical protein